MIRLISLVISCGLVLAACSTADGSVTAATDDQPALSGPAITRGGTSSAHAVDSLRGSGLQIDGSTEIGSFAIATYGGTAGSAETTVEFAVTPAPGASFVYSLLGSGSRYSTRQLRVQRAPGSDQLRAASTTGEVACGAIASGTPTAVAIVFRPGAQTFDVRINGAATPCANLPSKLQAPAKGFSMMDASNEGYGGRVVFGDLAMY